MDISEEQDVIQKDSDKNWSHEVQQCQKQNPVPVSGVDLCWEKSGLREDVRRWTWRYWWTKYWPWNDNVHLPSCVLGCIKRRGRGFCPSLLWWDPSCRATSSSGDLSVEDRCGPFGMGPDKGHKDDLRAEVLLWTQADRAGFAQPGQEKAERDLIVAVQNLEESCKKDGDRLFTTAYCSKTRDNGFKLKEGRFKLDIRKIGIFYNNGGETLTQVSQD